VNGSGPAIPAERFLPYLTWTQVRDLPPNTVAVLQVAATEQHGPHLPVYTDVLIGQAIIGAALAKLPASAPVFVLPPVTFGKSNEHRGFPGTVFLSAEVLYRTLLEVGTSVHAWGIRRLVLVNTHGGNRPVVDMAARDIRDATGMITFAVHAGALGGGGELSKAEEEFGLHAADAETSIVMAACPELVRQVEATAQYPKPRVAGNPDPRFRASRGDAQFAWLTRDVSDTGVIGDPTPASPEKGRRLIALRAERLAALFLEALNWEGPTQAREERR